MTAATYANHGTLVNIRYLQKTELETTDLKILLKPSKKCSLISKMGNLKDIEDIKTFISLNFLLQLEDTKSLTNHKNTFFHLKP